MKLLTTLVFCLVLMTTTTYAQDVENQKTPPSVKLTPNEPNTAVFNRKKGFTGGVFLGTVVPTGSYSDVYLRKDQKAGGADIGYSLGLQAGYRYDQCISLICEAQFISNKYNIQYSDDKAAFNLIGTWKHYTLMPGVKIEVPLLKKASFYTTGSFGVLFSTIQGDFGDILKSVDVKTHNVRSTATSVGLGFIFEDYLNMGVKLNLSTPAFSTYKPSLSMIQLVIGYDF